MKYKGPREEPELPVEVVDERLEVCERVEGTESPPEQTKPRTRIVSIVTIRGKTPLSKRS